MKIVRNNFIPPKGFMAINLFGVMFVRGDRSYSHITLNHETIHTQQMKEMLYVFFYIWYVIEWLIRLVVLRDTHKAYRAIGFEQEAYAYQDKLWYPDDREHYSWTHYLRSGWKR